MVVKFSTRLLVKISLIIILLLIGVITFIRIQKILTLQKFAKNIFFELTNNSGVIELEENALNLKQIALTEDKNQKGIINNYNYELMVRSVYQLNEDSYLYYLTLKINLINDTSISFTIDDVIRLNLSNNKEQFIYVVYDIGEENLFSVEEVSKVGTYRISMSNPLKERYDFLYWKDNKGNIYYSNDKVKITEKDFNEGKDLILYAVWEENKDINQEKNNKTEDIIKYPTLIFGSNWYKAKIDRSKITKIKIFDKYTPTEYDEKWRANVYNSDEIICYIINETELVISGSGKGKLSFSTDSTEVFGNFINVSSIEGIELLDTNRVTIMDGMFNNCQKLKSINLSDFDTRNVTSMNGMFLGCSSLQQLDLSTFNTSKVKSMGRMFNKCSNLTSLDLSSFKTDNVESMTNMFSGCNNLTSLDLSNFNTSDVTTMAYMFKNCSNLVNLNLSSFDTSKVINMKSVFDNCNSLVNLELSNFDTSEVTTMAYMFKNCSNLVNLNLRNFNTKKVSNIKGMFKGLIRLNKITLGEEFNFNGDGTTNCLLPIPNNEYISDANGKWYIDKNTSYLVEDIPNNVAATYYAVFN